MHERAAIHWLIVRTFIAILFWRVFSFQVIGGVMQKVVISGTGLFTPSESVSNAELVASFTRSVERFNEANAAAIASGEMTALAPSSR